MDEERNDFFIRLKEELLAYVQLRFELFRIATYEKIAKITAYLVSGLMLTSLFFFFAIFGSLTAGYYFSELTGSIIQGFGIIAVFYLFLLIMLIAFRKQLFEKMIINKVIEILAEHDDKTENKN